jgi:hypothetical protein
MTVGRLSTCFVISAALAAVSLVAAAFSPENSLLWLSASATILLSGALIGREAAIVPTLFLIIFVYWVEVACDIVLADIDGVAISSFGGLRTYAMLISFLVLVVMSLGMRIGFNRRWVAARRQKNLEFDFEPKLVPAFRFYIISTVFVSIIGFVATLVPSLAQPLGALASLKLVSLFILVICLKRTPSGILLMALLMLFEGMIGASSYIASFQRGFLTIIAAAMSGTAVRIRGQDVFALIVGGAILVFVSVVWTAVKPDFRVMIAAGNLSTSERIGWVADQVVDGHIDYIDASRRLIERVGYTHYYGLALARQQEGLVPQTTFWLDAVKNVVMPRVLFPDKAALNDTAITTLLTGVKFDNVTSVSIGFVAEAQMDFGFPMMLAPLALLGYIFGYVGRFLMSARGSDLLNQGFAAAVTCGAFSYATNIDKNFGTFTLSVLVILVIRHWSATIVLMTGSNSLTQKATQLRA